MVRHRIDAILEWELRHPELRQVRGHALRLRAVHADNDAEDIGLDFEKLTYRFNGRDMRLTDVHGRVIREILA